MGLLAEGFMRKTALRAVVFLIIVFQQEGIRYLLAHKVNRDVACGRVFSTLESD
jgi:hypothetical protein